MSRSRLKRALLFSLTIFGSAVLFQIAWAHSLRVAEVLYILETGSAASAPESRPADRNTATGTSATR